MTRDPRVVVVGAGCTGLVCAIHLARAGLSVTVLEHARAPGGGAVSGEVTLPGYVHDHCAGFNPMTIASPAIRELDLEAEGLRWISPPAIMAHPDVARVRAAICGQRRGWLGRRCNRRGETAEPASARARPQPGR